ncbi:hypothetical protein B0T20DRAFT_477421 [Sordaria brevicollis]|uniref:Uncharacterized protein n=1 Tax=Sordaria brevicollis TaxID=83679 RepID=A0AAE0UCZ9_SORBR|nr:hypothetical protein B0T20DRAFT_477421 [Sordaria brevicollis]
MSNQPQNQHQIPIPANMPLMIPMPDVAALDETLPINKEDIDKAVWLMSYNLPGRVSTPWGVQRVLWVFFKNVVIFMKRQMREEFRLAPLAVTREFLQKEHLHYAHDREAWKEERRELDRKKEELEMKGRELAAREAKLVREKRRLAVERIQLETEKKLVRAGLDVPVVTIPRLPNVPPSTKRRKAAHARSASLDVDVRDKQEPKEKNEIPAHLDIAQPLPQLPHRGRKRTRSQAGLDEPQGQLQYAGPFLPRKPIPSTLTPLESSIRTTSKVVDMHILKQPFTPTFTNRSDPNVDSTQITAILSSLLNPNNSHRLRYWRKFEREAPADTWFCWYGAMNVGYANKVVNERWHCSCEKLFTLGHTLAIHSGCVWVKRDGETGLLSFVWKEVWEKIEREKRQQ